MVVFVYFLSDGLSQLTIVGGGGMGKPSKPISGLSVFGKDRFLYKNGPKLPKYVRNFRQPMYSILLKT